MSRGSSEDKIKVTTSTAEKNEENSFKSSNLRSSFGLHLGSSNAKSSMTSDLSLGKVQSDISDESPLQ